MRRAKFLALLLLTASAPPGRLPVPPVPPRHTPKADTIRVALPVPPIPPRPPIRRSATAQPLPAPALAVPATPVLQPAPLPDRDKYPPPRVRLPIEASPAVFWPLPDMGGDGFVPGSAHQIEIERPNAAVPGVKFTVPLN